MTNTDTNPVGIPGDVTETVTTSSAVSASWNPDTTTVCDTFQFAGVNVNELGDTPTDPESPEETDTDTDATGAAANRTPNEPVEPSDTETDDTDVSIDCTSSSVTNTDTNPVGIPGDVTETVTTSSAVSASWNPDTTTVCDTFQFAGVNVNELGDTPTDPESPEETDTDTDATGAAANRTPNEPVEPSDTETDDTDVSIDCTTVVVVVVEPGGEEGIGAHAEMTNAAPAMQAAASAPALRVKRFTMSPLRHEHAATYSRRCGLAGRSVPGTVEVERIEVSDAPEDLWMDGPAPTLHSSDTTSAVPIGQSDDPASGGVRRDQSRRRGGARGPGGVELSRRRPGPRSA